MKKSDLTSEQREELEKFGANTWFVEYLYNRYKDDPDNVPRQWQLFFGNIAGTGSNGSKEKTAPAVPPVQPGEGDELRIIAGSSARILENMETSLTIPVATSQRTIPVKLLEENRIIINQQLKLREAGKVSFTHLIAWAILKAVKTQSSINNAFTIIDGKPQLIRRKHVNLGLAIDIERKDGSRSLIVPNIKKADTKSFSDFLKAYEDIVQRSRKGTIDPSEFLETTITLTNPGTIGTVSSVPRLMSGQGAIIATGVIQYPAEYQAMSPQTISTLGISKIMNITSTYDHRIVQGAESGLFLKEVHDLLTGEKDFYGEIFDDLGILQQPMIWKTDYQPAVFSGASSTEEIEKQARVLQLINLYRVRGHLAAQLDPLDSTVHYHAELDPSTYNFTIWDLDREFITGGFSGIKTATLRQILDILQKTYCSKIGVEYMHIQNPAEKIWIQSKMEPLKGVPVFSKEEKLGILDKLLLAESFEHFIHNKFIGHKRFSLEGSETVMPVLDLILNEASEAGIQEVVFGMAHRGRLNVLANIIGKSYESIFSEFEDIKDPDSIEGSGDVKYHLGATGKYRTKNQSAISVAVASNPSHLEWVDPVVEGIVRAKQTRMNDTEHLKIMPLLIHGDAAFAGQGVVAETLNLSQLKGYRTGGTVHIIINNQIGFTTTPEEARSSTYATDVAKMIQSPIFHVNGEDPEAAVWTARLAFEFRQIFKKDVVIDLLGYRRHGHNEGDEPGFTQPLMYQKIKNRPSVTELYLGKLIREGVITEEKFSDLKKALVMSMDQSFEKIHKKKTEFKADIPLAVSKDTLADVVPEERTAISADLLNKIVLDSTKTAAGFSIHPKLSKFLEKRRELAKKDTEVDWAFAETLAFGSLLLEGTPVRLSGQDSVRGTFSQRHLMFTDIITGKEYLPLNHMSGSQARIEALDSLLSEAAVLGFEYGYSSADPLALVIWEAQFGDFANGAQIIIDNFIAASQEKWQTKNSVVLLLPHGFEGQGPEHSSARLERFLILCAEENMQVCNLTTPAQYFHVLRRQIKQAVRKPLVIMTPKSLLRLPEARSSKNDFLNGKFLEVIDDSDAVKDKVDRIILTSGKVYYDLLKYRNEKNISGTAIVRMEQFYPFKKNMLKEIFSGYRSAEKIVWVQEEPLNMGAWNFLSSRLSEIKGGRELLYSGRPEGASPAVGSAKISSKQQAELVERAFRI